MINGNPQVLRQHKPREYRGHGNSSRLINEAMRTRYGKSGAHLSRNVYVAIGTLVVLALLLTTGAGSALAAGFGATVDQSKANVAVLGISAGQIAFTSTRAGDQFIFQYDFGTNKIQQLTKNPGDDAPAWSPDGKQIAYASLRSGTRRVVVMKADGSDARQIAPGVDVSWSPDGKQIVFSSDQGTQSDVTSMALITKGPYQIYSMNLDGSGLKQLTKTATIAIAPDWSPDGKQITYSFFDGQKAAVYVMNTDGSNPRALSQSDAEFAATSVWSPDGKFVLYAQGTLEQRDIFIAGADGSNPKKLTDSKSDNWLPTWSPDGKHFAFASSRDRSDKLYDIYVQNVESGEVQRITDGTGNNLTPSWNPVAESPVVAVTPGPTVLGGGSGQIVFQSKRDGDKHKIFTMNSDGSNVKLLAEAGDDAQFPVWSPDGQAILFQSNREGSVQIYKIGADGKNLQRLTDPPGDNANASFTPDGKKIIFTSSRDTTSEIYIMNTDGSGATKISTVTGSKIRPVVSPDGKSIAFSNQDNNQWQIYTMGIDGSNLKQIKSTSNDLAPTWAPDSEQLTFMSDRTGKFEIYTMNRDGSAVRQITSLNADSRVPVWSLDGTKILFFSNVSGNYDLYTLDVASGNLTPLAADPAEDRLGLGSWRP